MIEQEEMLTTEIGISEIETPLPPPNENVSSEAENSQYVLVIQEFILTEKLGKPVKRRFPCMADGCNKEYVGREGLRSHMYEHNGEPRPYPCSKCTKTYTSKWDLARHDLKHAEERPFQCDKCPEAFASEKNLNHHGGRVHNDRPYACHSCLSRFTSKRDVQRHLLIHTHERSFACDQCTRRFKRKDHMKRHILVRHSDKNDWIYKLFGPKNKVQIVKENNLNAGSFDLQANCGTTITIVKTWMDHPETITKTKKLLPKQPTQDLETDAKDPGCQRARLYTKMLKSPDLSVNMDVSTPIKSQLQPYEYKPEELISVPNEINLGVENANEAELGGNKATPVYNLKIIVDAEDYVDEVFATEV